MHLNRQIAGCLTAAGLVLWAAMPAAAAEPLKVCAAENEMPYSNKEEQGFENKIARVIADGLGRPLEYVWWSDPRHYVRDYLDKGLCNLTVGLDTGDPRVLTTEAYYRSGYVFVTRKKERLGIESWESPALRKVDRIAFMPGTPAEVMIRKIGRYNDLFNYLHSLVNFKSRRNQYVKYDPAKLVAEVASGNAEVAVLWGPAAARYVKEAGEDLEMTVIADNNVRIDGEPVPHHYGTSMGVRKEESELLEALNHILRQKRAEIRAILEEEGIPTLEEGAVRMATRP